MGLILGGGTTKPQYPYDMWYGVQGDFTSKDYKLKRVGNLDLHRTLPIQQKLRRFIENLDGSVKDYLHQNDSRKTATGAKATIDSTDGNVMLEKPEYYMRFEIEGTKWTYGISEYPLPGFTLMTRKTLAPWFSTTNRETNTNVSGCWLLWDENDELLRDENGILMLADNAPTFRGGNNDAKRDGQHNSQLGMPRTAISKANARPLCKDGTHIGVFRVYQEIAWLQRIEYASLHGQDAYNETLTADGFHQGGLGNGTAIVSADWNAWGGYYPFIPCGVTAPLGNNTGRVAYTIKNWNGADKTIQVVSYRGLETPFEYLWMLADDILILHQTPDQGGRSIAYGCTDPAKFTSHSNLATTAPDGYKAITDIPRTSGYVWNFAVSYDGFTFPTSIGGGSMSGMCDYYYTPDMANAEGWYGGLLSCVADNGANCGFGYLFTNTRSSSSAALFGFRLCRF